MASNYRHSDKKVNRHADCDLGDNTGMIYEPAKIRSLRKERKWSQQELARRADLSQATISDLERGLEHVKAATLTSVAVALGVPLKEIMRVKKSALAENQDLDDAMSLALALDPATRAAWIAAGKALLQGRKR
jgi:transcriptional regulator with XRE-family HTH domain